MAKKKNSPKNSQKKASSLPIFLIAACVLVLVAAAAAALAGGSPSGSAGTPRLKADREVIDFGEVKLGETVTASFTLTNTGDAPVRFSEPPYVELIDGC